MKPFKTFEEQKQILHDREFIYDDENKLLHFLETNNYYRICEYLNDYLVGDKYSKDINLKKLVKIYEFDSELRSVLNKHLAKIELLLRTQIAYHLARQTSPDGYLNVKNFVNAKYHKDFIKEFNKEISRNVNSPIVCEFAGSDMPMWAAVELLSIGTLSKMFSNLHPNLRSGICEKNYFKINERYFSKYLRIVSTLRNSCAHRAKLYGTYFHLNAPYLKHDIKLFKEYSFSVLTGSLSTVFISTFVSMKLQPDDKMRLLLVKDLSLLFKKYRKYIEISKIGFPKHWKQILIKA